MKKSISLFLCLMAAFAMTACTASADQRTGEAEGYGGTLRVTVSVSGTDITKVEVTEHHETQGVGTRAIDALPDAIAKADSPEVDGVSGATVTSEAIRAAVRDALDSTAVPSDEPQATQDQDEGRVLEGMGMASTGRVGPGVDADGKQVYSVNVVFAHGSFDEDGRIRSVKVDQLELASPNLGAGATVFSGFPEGEEEVEAFMDEVSGWVTKGAKGDAYMLTSGSWRDQMDAFEQMMVGKTLDEADTWFQENFDQETGRPKADAVSMATMSLRGEHGDILTAIHRAWEDAQRQMGPTEGVMMDTNVETDTEEMMG